MPFALRPAASTSPSLKPRGDVSSVQLRSVSFTVPGLGVTIHCPSGCLSIVHCWSSQNSASAPKRRRTALPITVRILICRDSPPEVTSRIVLDMSFEPVATPRFVVAPGVAGSLVDALAVADCGARPLRAARIVGAMGRAAGSGERQR